LLFYDTLISTIKFCLTVVGFVTQVGDVHLTCISLLAVTGKGVNPVYVINLDEASYAKVAPAVVDTPVVIFAILKDDDSVVPNVPPTLAITVNDSTIPSTGETNLLPGVSLVLAVKSGTLPI